MDARRLRPVLIGSVLVLVLLLVFFAYELGHTQTRLRQDLDHRFRDRADVAAKVNEAIFGLANTQQKALNARRYGGKTVDPAVLVAATEQSNQRYAEILDDKGRLLAATPGSPAVPRAPSPL